MSSIDHGASMCGASGAGNRHGGWVIDDPPAIRIGHYWRLIPGDPDVRVRIRPVIPMLHVWLDADFNAHGWRLHTATLRDRIERRTDSAWDWLRELISVSLTLGYRSRRIERAFVGTVVHVCGRCALLKLLDHPEREVRQAGIRFSKHLSTDRKLTR